MGVAGVLTSAEVISNRQEPVMLRKLDQNWWTSFSFFIASVAICSGAVLYEAKMDDAHYGELFQMMVSAPGHPATSPVKLIPMTPSNRLNI